METRNNPLLKDDLVDLLNNTFHVTTKKDADYQTLLSNHSAVIIDYMDRVDQAEIKTGSEDQALLARCAPHYTHLNAERAGIYLKKMIHCGYDNVSIALIQHGAQITDDIIKIAREKNKSLLLEAIKAETNRLTTSVKHLRITTTDTPASAEPFPSATKQTTPRRKTT